MTLRRKDRRLGVAEGKRRYDLPLNTGEGTNFLVLLIALMTFLAAMALASSFALGSMTEHWSSGLENKLTVEIAAERQNGTLRDQKEIQNLKTRAGKRLEQIPAVRAFEIQSEEDVQKMISPWLGSDMTLGDIPLPGLISVDLENTDPDTIDVITRALQDIDPAIRVDTHESWLGDLLRLIAALQFAALTVVLIIGTTTVTAIAGGIRTRMALHHTEIELLHLMGASDEYITRQLQRHATMMGLHGGLLGMLAAVIILFIIGFISGDTAQALLPGFSPGALHIISIMAIPLLACLIAAATARFTVLRVLARMP